MGRIHGKRGALFMSLNYGDLPSQVAFLSDWTITFAPSFNEVTAYGDPHKLYTASAVETSGDFSGFYDDSSRQLYLAARDGLPRNFYLYPDTLDDPGQCWTGSMLPDFAVSAGVGGPVSIKATWKAAGPVTQAFTAAAGPAGALAAAGTAIGQAPIIRVFAVLAATGTASTATPGSPRALLAATGTASAAAAVSGGGGLLDESGLAVSDEGSAQILDEG